MIESIFDKSTIFHMYTIHGKNSFVKIFKSLAKKYIKLDK